MQAKRKHRSAWIVALCAAVLGLWLVGPVLGELLHHSKLALAGAELVITIVWVGIVVAIVRQVAGLCLSFWGNVAAFLACVVALVSLALAGLAQPLGGIALLLSSAFLGCVVGVIIREPNITLPIALVTPVIDFWTVNFGPVKQVLEGAPHQLPNVSAAIPGTVHLQPIAFIGAGDFLFMALFLSVAQRLDMNTRRTAWLFFGLVSLAMLMIIGLNFTAGVPGMVVIALGFVAANLRHFKLSRQEAAITFGIAALACIAIAVRQMR